ncbi:hypothetical protein HD806DRAFT_350779 [Xylariaceae sp. AK1471]|nr:hypothetical protein HD806DRAFT_350779 [Xylariaceae sp. AK1471]
MRYILPIVILRGSLALSVDRNYDLDLKDRALDAIAGGYDKHPRESFETTNGTSPAPRAFGNIFTTRDQCNNGIVDCSDYQCDQCGSCCGGGTCAENFGNCCSADLHCSFGFSCCTSFQGCCYEDTSFCCDYSPTGCCVKGTQCTPNGCVGTPAFFLASVTTTTTYTSIIYHTSTVVDTSLSTNFDVTTEFVTSTVTSDNIDVATVTNYVTSTKVAKRFVPDNPKRTEHPIERRIRPTPPAPSPTVARGLKVVRDGLENIGVLQKRVVTSYIYDFVFVWDTLSSGIFETSTVVSQVDSMSTRFSTITSTLFKDAKSTTTVFSTLIETVTQPVTSTPDPPAKDSSTKPPVTSTVNNIVIQSTFVVGVTNSGSNEAATVTTIIDGGGASGVPVATGASKITSGSDTSSSKSDTVATTSSTTPSNIPSTHSDLSTGAKAGIGAGAGAAGLALLAAIAFFALGKRRRPTSTVSVDNSQAPMAPSTVANWTPPPPPLRHSHLDSREVSYTERAAILARSMENRSQPVSTPSLQEYQQSSNFSPVSRGASPSTPSELMMGYESPRGGMQEMGGTTENMGWYMGPNTEHHEMPGQEYYEMPSPPESSHFQHPRQGHAW